MQTRSIIEWLQPPPNLDPSRRFYVYYHWATAPDLTAGRAIFYVGKGTQYGYSARGYARATEPTGRSAVWVKAAQDAGTVWVSIAGTYETEREAHCAERTLIAGLGRAITGSGRLVNLTAGGEGTGGWVQSTESRAKMSRTKKALGRKATPAQRALLLHWATSRIKSPGERADCSERIRRSNASRRIDHRRKVVHTVSGQVFDSVTEAEQFFQVSHDTMHTHLRGRLANLSRRLPARYMDEIFAAPTPDAALLAA